MYKHLFPLLIFLSNAAWSPGGYAQQARFSAAQVNADVAYLQTELERYHPNLYVYTTAAGVDTFFKNLYPTIPDSLTVEEAYGLVTSVYTVLKDGHTLFYPPKKLMDHHNRHSGFFPFRTWWDNTRMFITMNYTKQPEIPDGVELLSINGLPVARIMAYMLPRMMRDGVSDAFPVWVLNNWFFEYYSYFYGHPDTFDITYQTPGGAAETKKVSALTKPEIFANREKNYPTVTFGRKENGALLLDIDREHKTAVLTIKDFHTDLLRKEYKQNFPKTIRRYFSQIKADGVEHLILDLRDNQGGYTRYGEMLLEHLLSTPFQLVETYYKVDKSTAGTRPRKNKQCKGPSMGAFRPRPDAFSGKLYVLINGGSFSNTGMVCSALQHARRGVFIGEETGGNKHILSADVNYRTLPNTGIRAEVPTLQFGIRDMKNNTGHGVLPDYPVQPGLTDLQQRRDAVKTFALGLIGKSQH